MPVTRLPEEQTVVSYYSDEAEVSMGGLKVRMKVDGGDFGLRDMQHVSMGMYVAMNQLRGVLTPEEWEDLGARYSEYQDKEDLPDNVTPLFPRGS